MKQFKLVILIVLLFVQSANSQIQDLNISDSISELYMRNVVNSAPIRLSDYHNKLLIIDFWATNCTGCVAGLPRMQALEKKFKGEIKVLPVTYEKKQYVETFLKSNRITKALQIASVVNDTILHQLFKHVIIPHEVWVYRGKIIAITDEEYVDSTNVTQVLQGKSVNWPIKNDYSSYDERKPIFNVDSSVVNYRIISGFKEKYSSGFLIGKSGIVRDSAHHNVRSYIINQSILASYVFSWMKILGQRKLKMSDYQINGNTIVWKVSNVNRYTADKRSGYLQDWMRKNSICFETQYIDVGQSDSSIYKSQIADLNALLGLDVKWVNINVKSLELKKIPIKRKKYNSLVPGGKKYSLNDIIYLLNQNENNPNIYTNLNIKNTQVINLRIESWTDIGKVTSQLEKQGFTLKPNLKKINKLIFYEVEGGKFVDGVMQNDALIRKKNSLINASQLLNDENKYFSDNTNKSGVFTTKSGVQYKIIKNSDGPKPKSTNNVLIHYTAKLLNGAIFDSSYQWGRPVEFKVIDLIPGFSEAIQLMGEGSKWELFIPSNLAYGAHTAQGTIPPNSALIYEVDLIKILN